MAKRIFIGVAVVLGLAFAAYIIFKTNTKSYSPEETVNFTAGDLGLEIFYNRPYKKNREIFGVLVPYNEVWRTGANEATTFKTNKDILIDGSLLPAGKYTLWTIPMENSWKVLFNSKMYPWGINIDREAYREPEFDSLALEVSVQTLQNPVEQFTIDFEEENDFILMNLMWDRTLVIVPISNVTN